MQSLYQSGCVLWVIAMIAMVVGFMFYAEDELPEENDVDYQDRTSW